MHTQGISCRDQIMAGKEKRSGNLYSIVRHRGGWSIAFHDKDGVYRKRALGTDDYTVAKARAPQRWKEIQKPKSGLVAALYQAYLEELEERGKSSSRQRDAWKRLAPVFAPLEPTDVTRKVCHAYVEQRRDGGASRATIHTELLYLRAALRSAERAGLLTKAPHITLPDRGAPASRHLTRDQFRLLLDGCCAPHIRLYMQIAIATAARPSAILDLQWDQVDFELKRIDLNPPGRAQTSKRRPIVPINDKLLGVLWEARQGAISAYVIEYGGGRVQSIKSAFASASARSGVKATPYSLRHTAAVWMAEAGVRMSVISQYMGHTSTSVTERTYARYSPDYLQDAAAALDY
ncbi:hypothetical protein CKO24_14430 [Rhodothalassium salexigens DSM 2132]|nr:hypothetical protein [Rhodothalassium salexigens DSM 2132]